VICQRPGCGKPVPASRRKYCSDKCARIVNRDSAAARARRRAAAIAAKGGDHVATRVCLSCNRRFLSEGPWNRICPFCSERNVATPPRAAAVHCGLALHVRDIQRLLGD
jgi:predicted nucleic acid-binding Zn ribbon protein